MSIRVEYECLKMDVRRWLEKRFISFVWMIPPKIALWCFVRVVSYSESGCPDWYKEVHDSFMAGHNIKRM